MPVITTNKIIDATVPVSSSWYAKSYNLKLQQTFFLTFKLLIALLIIFNAQLRLGIHCAVDWDSLELSFILIALENICTNYALRYEGKA